MLQLNGKTLVFTDCHAGLKGNSVSRLNILVKVFKEIIYFTKDSGVKNVIFCGDAFHERVSINSQTLNVALKCFSTLAKYAKVYMILGNHDLFAKNSVDITSVNVFKDTPNIEIIDKPLALFINDQKALLVPWLSDLSIFKDDYDLMFGHFDISSQYLITSYIEDNTSKNIETSDAIKSIIDNDSLLASTNELMNESKVQSILKQKKKSEEYIGNFIDHLKIGGTCYSGHIHSHKEAIVKQRKLVFIGSPYQTTFGERGCKCGFYILSESNNPEFIETTTAPKHIELRISKILDAGVDNFDYSIVAGNIIKKVYDKEIDTLTEAKISQRINDRKPYDELVSEYDINVKSLLGENNADSIKVLSKSKLDYVYNYIENIDNKVLDEKKIDKKKLYSILESYYNKVMENFG